MLANFRLDKKRVFIKKANQKIPTGLKKFGALIGDHVEIGSNALLNPGTIIGKGSVIYPAAIIRGVIPEHVIVKVRQQQEITQKR